MQRYYEHAQFNCEKGQVDMNEATAPAINYLGLAIFSVLLLGAGLLAAWFTHASIWLWLTAIPFGAACSHFGLNVLPRSGRAGTTRQFLVALALYATAALLLRQLVE